MPPPLISTVLNPLSRSDGSATYSHAGYSIACGINGPVEVQRKDELPDKATVEVLIRPAYGVGGIRERWLEDIVRRTLKKIILVDAHPRTLVQVTLQVVATPSQDDRLGRLAQADSNLSLLPALLQASTLALLSTSIPLSMTLTSTLIAVSPSRQLIRDPSAQQLRDADSIHVLAFSSRGDLLVVECEGQFDMDTWQAATEEARRVCRGQDSQDGKGDGENVDMDVEDVATLEDRLRDTIREKVVKEQRWKESLGEEVR